MKEYSCRKCGVMVRGDGFGPLKLCNVCSSDLLPGDRKMVEEFSDTLKVLGMAKTPKQRAAILLHADREARSADKEESA